MLVLEFYCTAVHPVTVLATKLPFLPLMLTSVYCAVGVVWAWLLFYVDTLRGVAQTTMNPPGVVTLKPAAPGKKTTRKEQ